MSFSWYLWRENVSLSVEVVSVNYSSSFNWWEKKKSIKTIVLFRSWYRKRRYPLMKNTQYFFTRVFYFYFILINRHMSSACEVILEILSCEAYQVLIQAKAQPIKEEQVSDFFYFLWYKKSIFNCWNYQIWVHWGFPRWCY